MDTLQIELEITEIEEMTKEEFTKICKEKVKQNAFIYLENKKNKSDKRKHIEYKHLEMAQYLKENELSLTVKERQQLFQCRMCDLDVKVNRSIV